jgi:amidase
MREFMDKKLFTAADHQSIDIIDTAIGDLRKVGATIVDPGEGGALFQGCIDQHIPRNLNALFIRQFRALFPDGADHISAWYWAGV